MNKKLLILFLLMLIPTVSFGQEWMSSIEIAKKLAIRQNKMLLVMWEDSMEEPYPVIYKNEDKEVTTDLINEELINDLLWEYFVLVKIYESDHQALYDKIKKNRSVPYLKKFNDDSVKVMDINGNILNVNDPNWNNFDLSSFIKKYGLDTSFLASQLLNYYKRQDFHTTLDLASKYIEYATFVNKEVRPEIIKLSDIYLKETEKYIEEMDITYQAFFQQKFKLYEIKQLLVLNNPRKAIRLLRKIGKTEIHETNQSLFSFLNYTASKLLRDERSARMWKSKVSLVDLKKAEHIIKSNS